MYGWTPLYQQILASSVWGTPLHVKVAWITILASADKNGIAPMTISGLARLAGITQQQAQEAYDILSTPDPDTLTQAHEGRRIQRVENGWLILSFEKYRRKTRELTRQEQNRDHKAAVRNSEKQEIVPETSEKRGRTRKTAASEYLPEPSEAQEPTAEPPKRPRNELLDYLATIDGSTLDQVTQPAWGRAAKALSTIKSVCPTLTVDELERRRNNYLRLYPRTNVTSTALASHWAACDKVPVQPVGGGGRETTGEKRRNLVVGIEQTMAQHEARRLRDEALDRATNGRSSLPSCWQDDVPDSDVADEPRPGVQETGVQDGRNPSPKSSPTLPLG